MFAKAMFKGASQAGEYTVGESLRFNDDDSAYLTRTPASAGNRKTWTWSGWIKRGSFSEQFLFGVANAGNNSDYTNIQFFTGRLNFSNWTGDINLSSSAEYRDSSAWYHIVCAVDTTQATASERIRMYVNGNRITDWQAANYPSQNAELPINNSVVHQIGARLTAGPIFTFDGYLAEVYFVDGQALGPTSFGGYDADGYWKPKRYSGTFGTNGFYLDFANKKYDGSSSSLNNLGLDASGNGNNWTASGLTTYRKGLGDYVANSTVSGTTYSDRTVDKLFNGIAVDNNDNSAPFNCFEFNAYPGSVTFSPAITATSSIKMWVASYLGGNKTVKINGTNYTFTSTGAYNTPATLYTLPVTTLTSIEVDTQAANDTRFYGIVVDDVLLVDQYADIVSNEDSVDDTPTVNYATWNPLTGSTSPAYANGNLFVNSSGSPNFQSAYSTFGVSSGKWYAEFVWSGSGGGNTSQIGVASYIYPRDSANHNAIVTGATVVNLDNATTGYKVVYVDGVRPDTTDISWSVGDTVGIALDADNNQVRFYRNGTEVGASSPYTATLLAGGNYYFFASIRLGADFTANFGQRPFAYTPPTGYKALNSKNLPKPTILDGGKHFDTVLYTGNGTSQTITGLGFQPDIVWLKSRNYSHFHLLMDSVRGNTKFLTTNATSTEDTVDTGTGIVPTSDGFSVQYSGDWNSLNTSGRNVVAWTWNAGGTTVTNTNGTITSSVRANTDAGISIVSYTGNGVGNSSIGHGLSQAPEVIIVKDREALTDWIFYTTVIDGSFDYLLLQSSAGKSDSATPPPTNTVFNGAYSGTTNDIIAYCFHSVDGFSKFSTYTGNGSTDGPFVYTGFRPAFVMVKQTNTSGARWNIWDVQRDPYNLTTRGLFPNLSDAEVTAFDVDLVSNGFKLRDAETTLNGSGSTYIYMAFAENPFKKARAR